MAEGRGWAGLPGLSAGSQPWGEPSEFCWVFLTPSMGEEGKQLLQSPSRDPHLSWGGGISSSPSASSLPACSQGLSVGMLLAPTGSCPTLCIRRLLGRVFPRICLWGLGAVVVTTLTLLSPGPHIAPWGQIVSTGASYFGAAGEGQELGGEGSTPGPPLPAALSWWWREKGAEAGTCLCRECSGRAGGGHGLCCPSLSVV